MLDLKLLEKQLDEVLEKETSETMTSWLLDRRLKKYVNTLGEGLFVNITSNKINIIKTREHLIENNNSIDFSQNIEESIMDYSIAA